MTACEQTFLAMPLHDRKYNPVWCYLLLPLMVILDQEYVLAGFQAILRRLQGRRLPKGAPAMAE